MTVFYADFETETIATLPGQETKHPRLVLGCILSEKNADGARREIPIHSRKDLLTFFKSTTRNDTIIAHNAGAFDSLLVLDELSAYTTKVNGMLSGSVLISVDIEIEGKKCARIVDSMRVLQSSLDTATGGLKAPFPLACICEKKCGGYCAATPKIKGAERAALYAYCKNDVEILAEVYEKCFETLEKHGFITTTEKGKRLITAGSICVRSMFKSINEPIDSPVSALEYELAMQGYYGGRCQVLRTYLPSGYSSDVRSMYPYNATLPLPWGRSKVVTDPREARREFERDTLGIYKIRAYVNAGVVPPLPEKVKGRVLWHTGEIRGSYTGVELKAALPYLNGLAFDSALVYYETRNFYDFYTKAYRLKEYADEIGDPFLRYLIKIMLNSGYGKLASGPEHESLVLSNDRIDGQNLQHAGYSIRTTRDRVPSVWCRPGAAAYITAYGRARMLGYLNNPDIIPAYLDTDGLIYSTVSGAPLPDIKGLGGLSLECSLTNFVATAPKAYTYDRTEKQPVVKLKGVNLKGLDCDEKIDTFIKYAIGGKITRDTLTKARSGSRDDRLLSRTTITRSRAADMRLAGNDLIGEDYRTTPLHCDKGHWYYPGTQVDPREVLPWLRGVK